eukprot:1192514-Amphidinium_carterae.2
MPRYLMRLSPSPRAHMPICREGPRTTMDGEKSRQELTAPLGSRTVTSPVVSSKHDHGAP